MSRSSIAAALIAAAALVPAVPAAAQAPRLGTIDFPTSAAPAAQALFLRGALYLHSFECGSAARSATRRWLTRISQWRIGARR
ncbi:MAG: hypothetical protein OER21_05275 [Gemmatimonadota bacterium]|nr:hypothetical protein [Gemmatimonadota bacterium]